MSTTYLTDGIVLSRRPYRDADRLVTLYTDTYGKIEAIARGVRKPTSKLAGHLEPLSHASFMLARGRRFDVVATSVKRTSFRQPQQDLLAFALASYLIEAVDRFTREGQRDPAIYDLLVGYLTELERDLDAHGGPPAFQRILITEFFLFQLLRRLGYAPHLENCVVDHAAVEEKRVHLSLSQGGVVCTAHLDDPSHTLTISRSALETLRLMADGELEAVRLMNRQGSAFREVASTINHFLKYHLGEPLRSETFLTHVVTTYGRES